MTLKVRILHFLTTFTQLTSRLKNFSMGSGWLLVLGLKEGLLECSTVCVKSEVILTFTGLYVENYARFLQESNLTLAETQVKFQEIRATDYILLIILVVSCGVVVALIIVCIVSYLPCFPQSIADYYILFFGKIAGILVMLRAHH